MVSTDSHHKFVLLHPAWWDEDDIALIQTIGEFVSPASYRNTWLLSRTPGGYRYYAWKRSWGRSKVKALRGKYLWASELSDLLRQIQEVTQ